MRERDLFDFALRITDPARRDAFLASRCAGDEGLEEHLRGLLAAERELGSFLESPAIASTLPGEGPRIDGGETTDAVIGPYTLLEPIGEGGMGTVYLARQAQPVRREVALKVIKPGMGSAQIIARFEAERQALALMDHPNIARVLDAGATESGRPFFVMELVRGIPLTEYCDREQLSIPERLGLFVQVCRAVQHAHQKGIIHRDLKPSNILVTVIDGSAVPKVIDFGVAKATGQNLTERTLHTGFHQLVGTPLYMSPEQATLSGVDVDTRSDVYSLGVLLYELLTGTTPFDRETLRTATFEELWHMVRHEEPQKPSDRLSTLGDSLPATSARRSSAPRQLAQALKGDLDWVAMKALEKDRDRRYETAIALATDVDRHLCGQPVEACPPSVRYRLAKFVRRNRGMLSATALILLTLLAATGVSLALAIRAEQAEARAKADFRQARDAIDRAILRASDELKNVPGTVKSRRALLEDGLVFYQGFLAAHANDPGIKFDTARAERRVASIRQSIGDLDQARPHLQRAIALLEELVAASPRVADYRRELAEAHNSLAEIVPGPDPSRGRRKALAIYEALVAEDPGNPDDRRRVAGLHCNIGLSLSTDGVTRFAEAEPHLRAALAIWEQARADFPGLAEDPVELARLHHWLGNLLAQTGREAEAEAEYRRSLALLGTQAAEAASPVVVERIAHVKGYLAGLLVARGNLQESEPLMREVIAAIEPLWRVFPDVHSYAKRLGAAYHQLGCMLWQSGRLPEAEINLSRAVAVFEAAVEQHGDSSVYLQGLARKLRTLSTFLHEAGRHQESLRAFRRLLAIQERLATRNPDSGTQQAELAWWLSICPLEPLRDPARAVKLGKLAVKLDPNSAVCWRVLGIAQYRHGDLPAALTALNRVLEIDPDDRDAGFFLAMIHARQGDEAQALAWHAKAVQLPEDWFPSARLDLLFAAEAIAVIEQERPPKH